MSNFKKIKPISEQQISSTGVVSLAIRPNQSSQYGEGGLSAKELQRKFDNLSRLAISRCNMLVQLLSGEYISQDEEPESILDYILAIKATADDAGIPYDLSLKELFEKILTTGGEIKALDPTAADVIDNYNTLNNVITNIYNTLNGIIGENTDDISRIWEKCGVSLKIEYNEENDNITFNLINNNGEVIHTETVDFLELHNHSNKAHNDLRQKITNVEGTANTALGKANNVDRKFTDFVGEAGGNLSSAIETHNTSEDAHNDIRIALSAFMENVNTLLNSDDINLDQTKEIVAYIKNNKDLIDGITTSKVSVSDIIDNLTTNLANRPLSAKQGVELKKQIDLAVKRITNTSGTKFYYESSGGTRLLRGNTAYGDVSTESTVPIRYPTNAELHPGTFEISHPELDITKPAYSAKHPMTVGKAEERYVQKILNKSDSGMDVVYVQNPGGRHGINFVSQHLPLAYDEYGNLIGYHWSFPIREGHTGSFFVNHPPLPGEQYYSDYYPVTIGMAEGRYAKKETEEKITELEEKIDDYNQGQINTALSSLGIKASADEINALKGYNTERGSIEEILSILLEQVYHGGTPVLIYALTESNSYAVAPVNKFNDIAKQKANIEIASMVFNLPVSHIGAFAFEGYNNLESVTMPNNIRVIESNAFHLCSKLKAVTMPDAVESIGKSSFMSCTSLENAVLSNKLLDIGDFAFQGCESLKSINIPESLVSVGQSAFIECVNLEEIYFDAIRMDDIAQNKDIFSNAGINGTGIHVTIGKKVQKIPNNLFYSSIAARQPNIAAITFENDSVCQTIGDYAFATTNTKIFSLTIPEGIKKIGNHAFGGCNLKGITFPSTLNEIGDHAFSGCRNLNSVSLENTNVTDISESSFAYCTNLYTVYVGNATSINSEAFRGCSSLFSVTADKATHIVMNAFAECTNLGEIKLPAAEQIDAFAFSGCTNLGVVYLSNSLQYLGGGAFPDSVHTVFFKGTEAQWNAINKNGNFSNVTPIYY